MEGLEGRRRVRRKEKRWEEIGIGLDWEGKGLGLDRMAWVVVGLEREWIRIRFCLYWLPPPHITTHHNTRTTHNDDKRIH